MHTKKEVFLDSKTKMNGDGARSMTYSLPSLFKLINQQDAMKGNELAQRTRLFALRNIC